MSVTSASSGQHNLIGVSVNDDPAEGNPRDNREEDRGEEEIAGERQEDHDTNAIVCGCEINTRKFGSLAWLAVTLFLGVVFLVAGKVGTDSKAVHVSEFPVYRYLTIMLVIAIAWMSIMIIAQCQCIPDSARQKWFGAHTESGKQLIPTRLLVGVMFFGLGSSFMTMVELLEFSERYDCPSGDPTMVLYYAVRTAFIYVQLYFFYKLSRRSAKVLLCSHFLVMHLISVNLGTWIVTFVHDSSEELKSDEYANPRTSSGLQQFMFRHWGVNPNDTVGNHSLECSSTAEELESTAKLMEPYLYTFNMEYCLISAGLLLNVWLSLRGSSSEELGDHEHERGYDTDTVASATDYEHVQDKEGLQEVGTLWRFGFIFGLVYVPGFAAIMFNIMFSDTEEEDQLIYVGFQFFFFLSIFAPCVLGVRQLEEQERGKIHSKVDFYLLGAALVGVFFLDIFIIVASICELRESTHIAVLLIFNNITELVSSVAFTFFVYKALGCKLPQEKTSAVLASASQIREVASFLFMMNICFWAMYTFEVKKSDKVVSVVETFYNKNVWFYISHFVYPLAIFFHFHGAVCMVEILNLYSKVPIKGLATSTPNHQAVQA